MILFCCTLCGAMCFKDKCCVFVDLLLFACLNILIKAQEEYLWHSLIARVNCH